MKTIKNIISILCLGFTVAACSSDDAESIVATQIQNLASQSEPGKINLTWEYPEDVENTNRFIEICYYDPVVKKEVKKTVSAFSTIFTVDNALLRYGEYKFELTPFSMSLTPGAVQQITGTAERAPIIDEITTTELSITDEEISLGGTTPDGNPISEASCISSGVPADLLDNKTTTFLNTAYTGVAAGTTYHLDLKYPQAQEYLKFSYINRNEAAASFPSKIECYVKVNEEDEWTLVKTLQQEADGLPIVKLENFTSEVYKVPIKFNFFRFKVLETHTGKVNFSMAEFRIYDVKRYYYDPEVIVE